MQDKTDKIIREIADYVLNSKIESDEAYKIAHYNVLDALGYANYVNEIDQIGEMNGMN